MEKMERHGKQRWALILLRMCSAYSPTCGIIPFYSAFSGGGGGSGGSVSISACTITAGSSALVQANGGAGARSKYAISAFKICGGGGGGGGVVVTKVSHHLSKTDISLKYLLCFIIE